MDNILLTVKLLNFIGDTRNKCYIKYDHDCGHSYSYIDHQIVSDIEGNDELEEKLNDWMYQHEDRPPCRIRVLKSGLGTSQCGCNDDLTMDEVIEVVSELESWGDNNKVDINYLISRE